MNTMRHMGYTACIEYDERDNIFVGRILGIRSIISFHGQTVAGLRAEFEHAVKDYLADRKHEGVAPEKPASGKLLLRVPPEVHGRALVAAQAAGKSLNQWARRSCSMPCSRKPETAQRVRCLIREATGIPASAARSPNPALRAESAGDSRRIAELGDDGLVWPEIANADDTKLIW